MSEEVSASAPVPDAPKPSRRRWYIAGGVALVVVLVLVVGALWGRSSANGAVDDYDQAVAAWKKDQLPKLVDASTRLPSGLFAQSDVTSKASLAAQEKRCTELADSSKELAKQDVFARPEPKSSAFGFLSGDYRSARDKAAATAKSVEKFRKKAHAAVDQLVTDCQFSVAFNRHLAALDSKWTATDKTRLKPGATFMIGNTQYSCPGPNRCVPPKARGLDKFVKAYSVYTTEMGKPSELGKSEACLTSSLGKQGCAALVTMGQKQLAVQKAWLKVVKTDKVDKEWNKKQDAISTVRKSTTKALGSAIVKEHPELADVSAFDPAVSDPDDAFLQLAKLRAADLEKTAPKG